MTKSVLDDIPGLGPTRKEAAGQGARRRAPGAAGRPRRAASAVVAARRRGRGRLRASAHTWRVPGDRRLLGGPRRLVAGRVHRRCRPRVHRADPAAGGRAPAAGCVGWSTSAPAKDRWPGWRQSWEPHVVGVDPTWAQVVEAVAGAGGPLYVPGRRPRLPVRSDAARRRAWPAWCSSTSTTSTRPSPRWPGCCEPGGRFVFFLNHPLLQTPGSGWIDDQVLDPPEQYWRIGPYLQEEAVVEEVPQGRVHPASCTGRSAATSTRCIDAWAAPGVA